MPEERRPLGKIRTTFLRANAAAHPAEPGRHRRTTDTETPRIPRPRTAESDPDPS